MTEEEWFAATHPDPLLTLFSGASNDRKLRLFACACCRQIEHQMSFPEFVHTIEVAEQFADGRVTAEALRTATRAAESIFWAQKPEYELLGSANWAALHTAEHWSVSTEQPFESAHRAAGEARRATERDPAHREFTPSPEPAFTSWPPAKGELADYIRRLEEHSAAEEATDAKFNAREAVVQVALLRDIFGNPFRPATVDPNWLTSTVVALAEGIYAERAFDRMPILADALQDAGCTNEDVLNHCRDAQQVHVRGCWVVDLLLGKV